MVEREDEETCFFNLQCIPTFKVPVVSQTQHISTMKEETVFRCFRYEIKSQSEEKTSSDDMYNVLLK